MTKPLVRDTKKIIGLAARERLGVVRVEHAPSIEKPYVGPAVKDFTAWKFKLLEPFRKELESRESLVIPWTAPDSEVPHVEAGTSSDGRPARLALRE